MGVVELDRPLLREGTQRLPDPLLMDVQDVLQRARHEEVLLQQPQPLAGVGFVVGVEHLGDGLRDDLFVDRLVEVAGVEDFQRKGFQGPRAPQRQGVAGVDAVALDRGVVGDAFEHPLRDPAGVGLTRLVLILLGETRPS